MRKKLVIIAMAVLALLTAQCKKNEPKPSDDVMVPITGTVNFGGSKTLINTNGRINPQVGDKIYIYYGEQDDAYRNVGSLTCSQTNGQNFNFTGQIQAGCLGKTCTFMYLGTGSKEADGTTDISQTSTTISFASQSDVSVSGSTIANLNRFHVGSCKATVSQDGTVTLSMSSKMAIAYFQLKDEDSSSDEFKNATITISDLYATADIDMANGTLKGKELGNVTVKTDANGCFYMALIPQTDPQSNPVKFTFKSADYQGESSFSNGIGENYFYSNQGQGTPLEVEMSAIETPIPTFPGAVSALPFSVAENKKVYFSKGNLQCVRNVVDAPVSWSADGYTWKFADNQWDVVEETKEVSGNYVNEKAIGLFGWGTSGCEGKHPSMTSAISDDYYSGSINDTEYDWGYHNKISYGEGQTQSQSREWRTLTKGEWEYLFKTRSTASGIRYTKANVNGVGGVILVPDDWIPKSQYPLTENLSGDFTTYNTIDEETWKNKYEHYGCVFLPITGIRNGNSIYYKPNSMSDWHLDLSYWSSSISSTTSKAYFVNITDSKAFASGESEIFKGCAVRLVHDEPKGK